MINMNKVKLFKLAALSGHVVKIHDPYYSRCTRPFYFRVREVDPASVNPDRAGVSYWWLRGERVTATGHTAKRQLHAWQFVDLANVLSVR
jgi:hypothetical protein